MKQILSLILILCIEYKSLAQDATKTEAAKLEAEAAKLKSAAADTAKPWKVGGVISINGQQVYLSNWSAGGNNSISLGGLLNLFAKYKKGKLVWDNNLELGYGMIRQGNAKKWQKNDDKIQFTTKIGREASKSLYYTALGDFRTQFADGFNYPNDSVYISKFMAPAYALAALGLDYKPNDRFSLFVSPLTGKFTFVNDTTLAKAGAFGVQKEIRDGAGNITQPYKMRREELGAYLKMQYKTKVMENVSFQTVLELFSNYLNYPENIDVNWTTLTTFKVNKFISATFATQLIYDNDINILRNEGDKIGTVGPDVQFKQTLAVGFNYKF